MAVDLTLGMFQHSAARRRLLSMAKKRRPLSCFNTQPPEGGWAAQGQSMPLAYGVSTLSRPKAAGSSFRRPLYFKGFNTQPPEGGCLTSRGRSNGIQGFNTQPPEGGCAPHTIPSTVAIVSTLSRPKAAVVRDGFIWGLLMFQHSAARRRLTTLLVELLGKDGFNTQPPEGGCLRLSFIQHR